jgi:endonuclease/exonuclease/phosphatase family metal-dependent hydrolase
MNPRHRIMTFNINGVYGDDANTWEKRFPLVLDVIGRYKPDVIGLQEVAKANLEDLRQGLADYTLVQGNCYGDTPPQEYSSVFYKTLRYECLETGEFWFSDTPDVQSIDWGVDYPMGATWVKLKCLRSDKHFVHLNTHFEDGPWGETSRVNASKLMLARLETLAAGLPVVLTGDFNCNPWSLPYRLFLAGGFIDSYRAAGNADHSGSSTIHLYNGQDYFALEFGDQMIWRIDWILVKTANETVQTVASTIVHDASPPTFPSDHFPVVSEFIIL